MTAECNDDGGDDNDVIKGYALRSHHRSKSTSCCNALVHGFIFIKLAAESPSMFHLASQLVLVHHEESNVVNGQYFET